MPFKNKLAPGKPVWDFDVPAKLNEADQELLWLIMKSTSMDDVERQYWLNLTKVMKPAQIEKLRGILLREKIKNAEIDAKYPYASSEGGRTPRLHAYLTEHRYFGQEKKYAGFMVGVLLKQEQMSKRAGGRGDETKSNPDAVKTFLTAKVLDHEREILIGSLDKSELSDKAPKPSKSRPRDGKTKRYADCVGRLIDQGWRNTVIARKLLRADASGRIRIPDAFRRKVAVLADYSSYIQNLGAKRKAEAVIDREWPVSLFLPKNPDDIFFRAGLRSMAFDYRMIPCKFEQIPPYYVAVLSAHFYSSLQPSFRELGILSAGGEWREEAFQKLLYLLHRAERDGFTPSLEMMRLWMNDCIDLEGRVTKRRLPFDWVLCDDSLLEDQRKTARKLAGRILKPRYHGKAPRISEMISLGDMRYLQSAARCNALLARDKTLKGVATWIYDTNITYRKTASRWFKGADGADWSGYLKCLGNLVLMTSPTAVSRLAAGRLRQKGPNDTER